MNKRILIATLFAGALGLGATAFAQTNASAPAAATAENKDAALVEAVKAALAAKPELKAETLKISSKHGEITLAGQVDSSAQLYDIAETAQKVPGVKWINNEMIPKE